MMRRLYDIVVFFKEYFLFGLFLVLSFVLLATNDNQQTRSIRGVAVGSIGAPAGHVQFHSEIFRPSQGEHDASGNEPESGR